MKCHHVCVMIVKCHQFKNSNKCSLYGDTMPLKLKGKVGMAVLKSSS